MSDLIPDWAQQLKAEPETKQFPATPRAESVASPYAEACAQMMSYPRVELDCLLGLVQPTVWMKGLHSDEKGGWLDKRSGTFITFDAAREMIDARITELGLDAAKVNAYPKSHCSIAEDQAFHRMPFDQRMGRFRA